MRFKSHDNKTLASGFFFQCYMKREYKKLRHEIQAPQNTLTQYCESVNKMKLCVVLIL